MKTEKFLVELEQLIELLGYRIRKEKGGFRGDFCVLEGDKIIMMNKIYPSEYHVGQMVRFLASQELNNIYLKPAFRKELDNWFERIGERNTQ
ncbi:MAG: hypothetical protein WD272_02360 [Balneolales bacterium]